MDHVQDMLIQEGNAVESFLVLLGFCGRWPVTPNEEMRNIDPPFLPKYIVDGISSVLDSSFDPISTRKLASMDIYKQLRLTSSTK